MPLSKSQDLISGAYINLTQKLYQSTDELLVPPLGLKIQELVSIHFDHERLVHWEMSNHTCTVSVVILLLENYSM